MLRIRSVLAGSMGVVAGLAMVTVALLASTGGPASVAEAGNGEGCIPFNSTNTPTNTPDPTATEGIPDFRSLGIQVTCTPKPTETEEEEDKPTRTPTPTRTATPAPAPSSTERPPAPSATQPGGGVGAGGLRPPDTGTGASRNDAFVMPLLAAGAILACIGAGALGYGMRRRR